MKIFWISTVFSLLFFSSYSQNHQLSGTVTSEKGEPLEGAYIAINENYIWTSGAGRYSTTLETGDYNIKVTTLGYQEQDTVISIARDRQVNFVLKASVDDLGEVLVKGRQHQQSTQQKLRVEREYLEQEFKGSLASSLEKLPGFNAMQIGAGASKPIIRGLGLNRVAVAENGIKQEGQQWGADHGLEIDALQVEDLEIIKGVGAIAYGSDALGGVVQINNNRVPVQEGLSGSIYGVGQSVNNSLGTSARLTFKDEHWFAKGKFTGISYGDYNLPTDQISYLNFNIPVFDHSLKNTAGKEVDWSSQLGFITKNFNSSLTVSRVYQKSGFFPGSHGVPDIARVQRDGDPRNIDLPFQRVAHFKVLSNSTFFLEEGRLELGLSYQDNHRQEWSLFHTHYAGQEPPEVDPNLELDFSLKTYSIKSTYHRAFGQQHKTQLGIDLQWKDNRIKGFNFLLPEYSSGNYGLFAIHEYQPSSSDLWSLGLRFDYGNFEMSGFYDPKLFEYLIENGQNQNTASNYAQRSRNLERDFSSFNLRLGYSHHFNEYWQGRANIGTAFRLPTAIELGANGIHHGSFRHERGEPGLEPEKGIMADLSISYAKETWNVTISPYAYYFTNYIFLKPTGIFSLLPHSGQLYQYTASEALLSGIELQLEKTFASHFRLNVAGEYLYNQQLTSSASRNFPLPFTPANNLFIEAGYSVLNDKVFISNSEVTVNTRLVMNQDRIAQGEDTTPGYQILGLGWHGEFQLGSFEAAVNLRVDNLLNTRFFNHTSFYRRLQIPEPGRNIQLNIKIPFGNTRL
ncbi:TonB-dependent receptor [Autumnicola musiva]|uniref:TonB-dependent receptor n=1 Tax=Autumnicola musiva TaxID=3075589 RepID=A0ABU3D6L2_9FLAO|nr:TonB-dependent receptor [Zunongwangia sp. F117]MDT0677170.1 TonB-dependent receptor [Zunongwangia sp. F117]